MDLLSMIVSCSLYHEPNVVANVIQGVSGGERHYQEYVDEAGSIHGVMGLPIALIQQYAISIDETHDVCLNIQIGTALMNQYHMECTEKVAAQHADLCALFRYAAYLNIPKNRVIIRKQYTFVETAGDDEMSLSSEHNKALSAPLTMNIERKSEAKPIDIKIEKREKHELKIEENSQKLGAD